MEKKIPITASGPFIPTSAAPLPPPIHFMRNAARRTTPPKQKKKKQQHVERMYTLAERALMCSAAPSSRSIMHGCVSVTSPGDTTCCRACGGKSRRLLAHSGLLSLSPQVLFSFLFFSASRMRGGLVEAVEKRKKRSREEKRWL